MTESNFKLSTLPYKRITIESFEKEGKEILKEFKEAKSGEQQFLAHKKYYELNMKQSKVFVERYRGFCNC